MLMTVIQCAEDGCRSHFAVQDTAVDWETVVCPVCQNGSLFELGREDVHVPQTLHQEGSAG